MYRTNYSKGYVVEYEVPCFQSWLLLPAGNLWPEWTKGLVYTMAIIYLFLGIAIAADIFMFSIEMITSKKRLIVAYDYEKRKKVEREVLFWNETVANLTLMALGSSAPEILIAVIETLSNLTSDNEQGLGTFTIIGSAAYNLLVITAVCIMTVPSPDVKRVAEFGVFMITAISSLFAYLWLLIVLKWSSPNIVTIWEAGLTLMFFPLLVILAWFQDRGWWIHKVVKKPHVVSVEEPSKSPSGIGSRRNISTPTVIGVQPVKTPQTSFHFNLQKNSSNEADKKTSETRLRKINSRSKLRDIVHFVKDSDPESATVEEVMNGIRKYVEPSESGTRARARFKHAVISSILGRSRQPTLQEEKSSLILEAIKRKASSSSKDLKANNLVGHFSFSSANYAVVRNTKQLVVEVLFTCSRTSKGKRIGFSHVVDAARLNSLVVLPRNGSVFGDNSIDSGFRTSGSLTVKSSPPTGCQEASSSLSPRQSFGLLSVSGDRMDASSDLSCSQRTTVTSLSEAEELDELNGFWDVNQLDNSWRPMTGDTSLPRSPSRERRMSRTPASVELLELHKRGTKTSLDDFKSPVSVQFETREGSAKADADFLYTTGTLVFSETEYRKVISVPVVQNISDFKPAGEFFIILKCPSENTALGHPDVAKVTLIDNHEPGELLFKEATCHVDSIKSTVTATVFRIHGCDGKISVMYRTINGTAFGGSVEDLETGTCDFLKVDNGIIEFNHGETTKDIVIKVRSDAQDGKTFIILLNEANNGAKLGHCCAAIVSLTSDVDELVDEVVNMIDQETEVRSVREQWSQQFTEAMTLATDNGRPGFLAHFLHFLSFFWKVVLAFIPPRSVCGGWVAFVCSLAALGLLSACVEQFAKLLGCVIGLKVSVTGITLIALGTSMPDTFASKSAAKQDDTADAAIGNITGSNSVNVFLGLGLPWVINSIYRSTKGKTLELKDANLYFTVLIFMGCGVFCIFMLIIRRICFKGELGGSSVTKYFSGFILVMLWLVFVILCSLRAYDIIPAI